MDTSSLMEQILSNDNLNRAYLQVVRNKGAEGVDGMKYTELKEYLAKNGEIIKEQLRIRKYKPQPVRRVEIPKPDGGVRNLGVPTVTDRFIQQAIAQVLTREQVEVEKHAEKESYAGICDEVRIGVTLIFYLQNVVDFLAVKGSKKYMNLEEGVILGALSTEGKILLPINKTEKKNKQNQQNTTDRNYLVAAARDGDENAIENLTLEDIDTYSMLSRRITHEDVLSIVDSYFIPYGIESDQYAILGEILDCRLEQNNLTGENVWVFDICCNEMNFGVCINQKDLVGEPQVGRRFKGIVWMQGSIKYRE